MSEKDKVNFAKAVAGANKLAKTADEKTVLALTASYLAGKEAGKREAAKGEEQPG